MRVIKILFTMLVFVIGIIPSLVITFILESIIIKWIVLFILILLFYKYRKNIKVLVSEILMIIFSYISNYVSSLNPGTDDNFTGLSKVIDTTLRSCFFAIFAAVFFIIIIIQIMKDKDY